MISDLIKRRKKIINPKTKSLLKSKSPLLLKKKNKSSSEKVIHKSTSKLWWPLNGPKTSISISTNSKRTILTSFSSDMLTLENPPLQETSWKNLEKLMNNNWPEPNNKPRKTTWSLGSWQVLLMLIQTKEREEKPLNMPNSTFLCKAEDLQFSMPQATRITFQTWSWVHAKPILQSWSFQPKKVNLRQDSKKTVKQRNTLC